MPSASSPHSILPAATRAGRWGAALILSCGTLSCAENPAARVRPSGGHEISQKSAAIPAIVESPEAVSQVSPTPDVAPSPSPPGAPDHPSQPTEPDLIRPASQNFRPGVAHLDRFYADLAELERDEAKTPLRILWLGDSHTAADFLTDAVRNELWARFRAGGPGFVHAGLRGTRHGGVTFESAGRFRSQPKAPASRERSLDGVFGYGGIRTLPEPGAWLRIISPRLRVGEVALTYRLKPGDRFEVRVNGARVELPRPEHPGMLENASWTFKGIDSPFEFWLRGLAGAPELFGVDLLSEKPGIVLDTVGINGARFATPLAWEKGSFQAEVRRRNLSLFVLAFGTNEAFDNRNVEQYAADLRQLVSRLVEASPDASCWVLGPPDCNTRQGEPNERIPAISGVLERTAEELGCGYTSQAEAMRPEGGFTGWKDHSPPWARPDNIHLTVQGYEELGRRLARVLLGDRAGAEIPSATGEHPLGPKLARRDSPP